MKMPSIMAFFWAAPFASGERLQEKKVDCPADYDEDTSDALQDLEKGEACYQNAKTQSASANDWTIMNNFVRAAMKQNDYEIVPHDPGLLYKVGIKGGTDQQLPSEELSLRAFVKFFDGECTDSNFASLLSSLEEATQKSPQCGGGWLRKIDGGSMLQTSQQYMLHDAHVKKTTAAAMQKVGRATWNDVDDHTELNKEEIEELYAKLATDSGRYVGYDTDVEAAKNAFTGKQDSKSNTWEEFKSTAIASDVVDNTGFTDHNHEYELSDTGYEEAARSLNPMDMLNFIHREIDESFDQYYIVNYKGLSGLVPWYRNTTVGGCGEQSLDDLKKELKRCTPETTPAETSFQCGGWLVKK